MNYINKYDHYAVEDFVWDEQFRNWIIAPDASTIEFFTNWLRQNAEKEIIVQQAREVILSLTVNRESLSQQRKDDIIARTLNALENPSLRPAPIIPAYEPHNVTKRSYIRYALAIAAAILLIIAGIWLIVDKNTTTKNTDYAYSSLVKASSIALIETINTAPSPSAVVLSDGSRIRLDSGARISYAPSFNNVDKREVYLSGDAYFEITKDPRKPFFVHANGITTRVLGTSFTIKTDIARKGVTVEVITGRVEVYEQQRSTASLNPRKGNGVILTPNQKVTYCGEKKVFETSLVDEPVPIVDTNKKIAGKDFVFEDAPLSKVIAALENIYGIKVEVEHDAILNCPFTGDISEQNLYRKLDAICQSTSTSYEIIETKVFIKGQGCN